MTESQQLVRTKLTPKPLPRTAQHQAADMPTYSGGIHIRAGVHTNSFQEAGKHAMRAANEEVQSCREKVAAYLMERVEEFRELSELRQKGWNSECGDRYFENQRRVADRSDTKTAQYFFVMMKKIAEQLHRSTRALAVSGSPGRILDLCMAPGGFLNVALKFNPDSSALAFSLSPTSGGHEVLLPTNANVAVNFLDITMLAAEMGVTDIPVDHPDIENFLPRTFSSNDSFDLILCDGQVLRTHTRASYREAREARRLAASQLVLGLERVRPGGTMIVLLHRVEDWTTVSLLHKFSKFSSMMLFKPTAGHAKRSSFYMVATKIDPQHPEAELVIEKWKKIWATATFGTQEDYEAILMEGDETVEEVLEEFGSELIRLGKKIWHIQAKALANAPFIRGGESSRNKGSLELPETLEAPRPTYKKM